MFVFLACILKQMPVCNVDRGLCCRPNKRPHVLYSSLVKFIIFLEQYRYFGLGSALKTDKVEAAPANLCQQQ